MNYSNIELILGIADAGSISEAADNLFVSQPFLSAALKRIETEIGTPLFKRSKAGVELTPFGNEYIQHARHIAEEIDNLNNLYKKRQIPQLRLDVVSTGLTFLYPMFAQLRRKYRDIHCTFQLAEASTEQQIHLVNSGKYEVGLILLEENVRKRTLHSLKTRGLEYIKLHNTTSGICVSKKSRIFPGDIDQLDERSIHYLSSMPFVGIHTRPEDMHAFRYWPEFDSLIQEQKNKLVSSNIGMRAEMINQYDGFGTDAYCNALYEKYSYTEQVRFVPFAPEVRTEYELGWIQRSNQPRSVLANELYALLQE